MIISFAWTTKAFLAGRKSVTRRFWNHDYAKRFKPGMIVDAYNRSPRFGGSKIGELRVLRIYQQALRYITDDDELKEGGLWGNARGFIRAMGGPDKIPYVLEFVKLQFFP